MEEKDTTTIASGSDLPQTDAALNVDAAAGPAERSAPAEAGPLAAASLEDPPMSPAAEAPPTSSIIPAPMAVSANSVTTDSRDEACAEGQVPAAPSNTPKNNPLPAAEGYVTQPAELDDGGWFEPYIPQVAEPPAPEPAPKPKPSSIGPLLDGVLRSWGIDPTPTAPTTEAESQALAIDGSSSDTEMAKPSEIHTAPAETQLPPPRYATALEVFTWIKLCLLALTHLPEEVAELVTFWVILTWFLDALTVLPCLVLTGSAHEARSVLHILKDFCRRAALLAGFRRSDLDVICCYSTFLLSEPNLDKRTANLLSSLTDRKSSVVLGSGIGNYSRSMAIYAGENSETHKIENSFHIHIAPTNAALPARPQWLKEMYDGLPVHLEQYRDTHLSYVRQRTWFPSGLSSETAAIATPFGKCIVDAPELRQRLVALLKTQDQQRLYEMSNTTEAVVLEAALALSCDGRKYAYSREIATKANDLLESRGETARLKAEHAGRQLKKLGLPTCRISQFGNGLIFDKATVARIRELAAMYMVDLMEDTPAETENLHSQQPTENNEVEEVKEVMEVF
jgi:hypothetical protein